MMEERLVVDCAYWISRYPNSILVKVDNEYYLIPCNRSNNNMKKIDKTFAESAKKNEFQNYDYPMQGLEKKSGYNIELGRAISNKEFDELKQSLNLTDSDISKPFETEKGAFYGAKYKKTYTCIQIRVEDGREIEIEQMLKKKGIEASNGSPTRVDIRVNI